MRASAEGYPTAARSLVLNGKPDQKTLLEVQDFFDLPSPALVEKDWFVVRALAAVHDVQIDGLTPGVWRGNGAGTRLSPARTDVRGHRPPHRWRQGQFA